MEKYCDTCKKTFDFPEPEKPLVFLEEFGQWETISAQCPNCQENDRITIHFLNPNIPETEFDEIEVEDGMPEHERKERPAVRNLMWKLRPDLSKKDRSKIEKERKSKAEKRLGLAVDEFRKRKRQEKRAMEIVSSGQAVVNATDPAPSVPNPDEVIARIRARRKQQPAE